MSEKIVQLNEEVITSSRKSLCEEAQKCRIFFLHAEADEPIQTAALLGHL